MNISLNREQSKGLADFSFDIAKGLILGALGLATVVPLEMKIVYVFLSLPIAVLFIRFAIALLEDI